MDPAVIIFGALMAIVALLFFLAASLHRIDRSLQILEERSRPRQCRECGCTDEWGCDIGCEWVEPNLCSACLPGPRGVAR